MIESTTERKKAKAVYQKAWGAQNRAYLQDYKRQWQLKKPHLQKAIRRRWYLKHREQILAENKKYRATHGELYRQIARAYHGLPSPSRPCPELCELGCGRKAARLDHDHKTGAFRGWLCNRCNLALGALGDDAPSLMRAVSYLQKTNA